MPYVPDPSDLDDALSRGYERERIAAATVALMQIDAVEKLLGAHHLADDDDFNMLSDLRSNLEATQRRLQEAVDIAMGLSQQRAPRRPTADMLERIT